MVPVEEILASPGVSEKQRQAAVLRIYSDPGVPDSTSTTSPFWLEDAHPLSKTRSDMLPREVDVIIIGSGVTAASVARELLKKHSCATPKVAILDARDICSGATGRNGGHVNEGGFGVYAETVDALGNDAAAKITRFRMGHLHLMLQATQEDGLEETQFRTVESVAAYFDLDRFKESKLAIARFKKDMPLEATDYHIFEAEEARQKFLLPDIFGAITYPAGAVWPYKLIMGIFQKLRDLQPEKFLLESNTAVNKIVSPGGDETKFTVVTTRGSIKATHVIHCTNAHAGHLIPGLRGRIVPVRGHMTAQTPGKSFADQSHHSWTFIYTNGFDYLSQLLPKYKSSSALCTGGELMIGGGVAQAVGHGVNDMGVATDGLPFDFHTKVHLSGILRSAYAEDKWGEEEGKPVKSMWTGSMGFSTDGIPFVGKVPESLSHRAPPRNSAAGSEWIAAGYNGEGMVQAWRSGIAVAQMVLEELSSKTFDWREWLPEQLLINEQRIKDSAFQSSTPPSVARQNKQTF